MKAKKAKTDLGAKIFEGLKLSFQRLLEEKEKNNGVLVFSEKGKIVTLSVKQYKALKQKLLNK